MSNPLFREQFEEYERLKKECGNFHMYKFDGRDETGINPIIRQICEKCSWVQWIEYKKIKIKSEGFLL